MRRVYLSLRYTLLFFVSVRSGKICLIINESVKYAREDTLNMLNPEHIDRFYVYKE